LASLFWQVPILHCEARYEATCAMSGSAALQ
jgi:hypothetical protein